MDILEKIQDQAKLEAEQKRKEEEAKKLKEERMNKTFPEMIPDELSGILEQTIKKDKWNSLITFLCFLSSLTENSQFNISFNAISSSGKTYLASQIGSLFPNTTFLGYASPTSFFHSNASYSKEEGFIVDLSRQTLVFYDMPNPQLLERLRPLLSHDEKEIKIQITDRSKKALTTKHIRLKGFCSVIFASARLSFNAQELTRFILLSPEVDQEKISLAIQERVRKESNSKKYKEELENNKERQSLIERILCIQANEINDILIPEELSSKIEEDFKKEHKSLKTRHSRDVSRLIILTKSYTLLNLWDRKTDDPKILLATEQDYQNALEIWNEISAPQELNMPPFVYEVYKSVLLPLYKEKKEENEMAIGVSRPEIERRYYQEFGQPITDWQLRREILTAWLSAGLVVEEDNPENKRKTLFKPIQA